MTQPFNGKNISSHIIVLMFIVFNWQCIVVIIWSLLIFDALCDYVMYMDIDCNQRYIMLIIGSIKCYYHHLWLLQNVSIWITLSFDEIWPCYHLHALLIVIPTNCVSWPQIYTSDSVHYNHIAHKFRTGFIEVCNKW